MKKFGLIGNSLKHSISPQIHDQFFKFNNIIGEYKKYEINDLENFLSFARENLDGFNVTFPFKEKIIPFLDDISDHARKIGSVNCVKIENNKLVGTNTDYFGIKYYFDTVFKDFDFDKILVFGAGGASKALCTFLKDHNFGFFVANRTIGKITHNNKLSIDEANCRINEFDLIINTTSCGYNNDNILSNFDISDDCVLLDLNYEPYYTPFLKVGISTNKLVKNGLDMLIVQALASFNIWNDLSLNFNVDYIFDVKLNVIKPKIIIDGFMGSGKSSVSKIFNNACDLDVEIEKKIGMSISKYFDIYGENEFRKIEKEVLSTCKYNVISLGGGCSYFNDIKSIINDSVVIYLDTDFDIINQRLKSDTTRPLINKLSQLYSKRLNNYLSTADIVVENNETIENTILKIKELL